ncbi:alginate O-acetyltransferase AlgX-related protein [Methylobacterium sp. A49B]
MSSGRESVHVGRDGWLFLTGGTNRVMDRYRGGLRHWLLLRAWTRLIKARAIRAESLGIRCLHVIVPEKLSVYDDKTDGLRYAPAKASTRRLARGLARNPAYLDLLAPLRAARNGPVPLYLRTDTHWTVRGCLLAYREIMRALGAIPPADIGARPEIVSDEVMDIGEKLRDRPRERIERFMLQRDAERVEVGALLAAYEAEGRDREVHVGAHVVYRNRSAGADPRRLVLFGDSCAHFDPFLLTGMLAESFSEVHFVWSSSLDWDYIARVRPDILLFELAERFLARVPRDDFDVAVAGQRGTGGRLARIQTGRLGDSPAAAQ